MIHMKKLLYLIVALSLMYSVPAHAEVAVAAYGKTINIRQRSTLNSPVVGYLKDGNECTVIENGEVWVYIRSGSVSGYVMKEYLTTGDKAKALIDAKGDLQLTTKTTQDIKEDNDLRSRTWDHTVLATSYDVLSVDNGWIEVDLYGASGYVRMNSDCVLEKRLPKAVPKYINSYSNQRRDKLVRYAMQFLGGKYVWGGEDPNTGADCSGFVRYIYRHVTGIKLPRTSYTQCYRGIEVPSTSMRPGDLIFYANSKGTVGHVTMYIGDGLIVHAASTKSGIIISKWNYRTPKYIRRILED